jgi:hypothetical protein
MLPSRRPHHVVVGGDGERLLHGVHDVRLNWIDIRREVVHEVVSGQPRDALLVDTQVRKRGSARLAPTTRRSTRSSSAEARDVHEADDVRGVRTESGHDLTAVAVPGHDRRARLRRQHLPEPRDVVASVVSGGRVVDHSAAVVRRASTPRRTTSAIPRRGL